MCITGLKGKNRKWELATFFTDRMVGSHSFVNENFEIHAEKEYTLLQRTRDLAMSKWRKMKKHKWKLLQRDRHLLEEPKEFFLNANLTTL